MPHDPSKSRCIIMRHHKGFFLPVFENAQSKSLSRMKEILLTCGISWDYHVVLTFSNKRLIHSKSGKVWSDQYYFNKQEDIKRLKTHIRQPKIELFNQCLEDINHIVTGELIRSMMNKIRKDFDISYFWKYEEGRLKFRPHFHILFKFKKKKLCPFCFYTKMRWQYWDFGRPEVINIITQMQLERYIQKDFSKYSNNIWLTPMKRKWSRSRDIKGHKLNTGYSYQGYCRPDYALELFKGTRKDFVEHYKNPNYSADKIADSIERQLGG